MTHCRYCVPIRPVPPRSRICSRTLLLTAVVCGLHLQADFGWAQLLSRSIALQGARLMTMDGEPVDDGTLVITGKTIRAVGREVSLPLLAKTIDVHGATITPGLIDAYSLLGRSESSPAGQASPTRRAADAFDRYDTDNITQAIRHGVTAVFVSPRGPAGLCGTGAVVRLAPSEKASEAYGMVLKPDAALCIDLASGSSPVTRLRTLQAIHKACADAVAYRESVEGYEEDLAQYIQQLEKSAAKPAADSPQPKVTGDSEPAGDQEKAPAQSTSPAAEQPKPQKPRRPPSDPKSELVLRALDREIPVRVIAHTSDDLLNALELASEFSWDLIIDGATESYLVADQLAAAKATIVLGPLDTPGLARDDIFRRAIRQPGSVLDAAQVPWIVGSGAEDARRTRFIAFHAQLAMSESSPRDPLQVITADAARILKVDQQIGRLRAGMLADLVVWSGHPLDPATRVLRVFINGQQVYPAEG